MIDIDNPITYPIEIQEWIISHKPYFLTKIPLNSYEHEYEIIHKLYDMHIEEQEFIQNYIQLNKETEFTMWHNARIENKESYFKNGILSFNGDIQQAQDRVSQLLKKFGINAQDRLILLDKIKSYWQRDGNNRTNAVHFFLSKSQIHDPQLMEFSINLGGECVRWGMESINPELYRQEPYKRLWICGTPCSIKFKSKLKDICCYSQEHIVREIAYYFIINCIYNLHYIPSDTGQRIGNVPPEDILYIKEIKNFIEEQEKFEEYQNFYDELK